METMPFAQSKRSAILKSIELANKYYRSIIEDNSFYFIITDLRGNYTYLNSFFCKIMGCTPADYLGKNSLSLIIPEDHQVCLDTVQKCIINPNVSHWVVLRKPLNGGIIYTQWEFKLLFDDELQPLEILCIGHDITPLIIKQDQLQELAETRSDENSRLVNFTYIVSHNIRSHVANIVGLIDLNNNSNAEEKELAWDMIKTSANNLNDTLINLNEIISIHTNTDLPIMAVSLAEEIEKIITAIPVLLRDAEATVDYNPEKEALIDVNPAYFESILLNLFTNAIKYKFKGRPLHIAIKFENRNKGSLITFKDNGMGIDMVKHRHDLFKMYKTFHGNKDAKGMGLFILKSQVEAMRGSVEVESEVGLGTTFKLFFARN
jgi:PAS domain S-box-containing protein